MASGSIVISGETVSYTTSLSGPGSFTGSDDTSGHIIFDNNGLTTPTVWTIQFDKPIIFEAFSHTLTTPWFDSGEVYKITSSGANFTVDNPDNSLNIVSGTYSDEVVFSATTSARNNNKLWSINSTLLTSVSISYQQNTQNQGAIQIAVKCIAHNTVSPTPMPTSIPTPGKIYIQYIYHLCLFIYIYTNLMLIEK